MDLKKIASKIVASTGIKCIDIELREFQPSWKVNSPYETFDGKFTFKTPNGKTVVFDGRLDPYDQTGTMTVDGQPVEIWEGEPNDNLSLEFLDIDGTLDDALADCIKQKMPEILA